VHISHSQTIARLAVFRQNYLMAVASALRADFEPQARHYAKLKRCLPASAFDLPFEDG
jgi:capsid protein